MAASHDTLLTCMVTRTDQPARVTGVQVLDRKESLDIGGGTTHGNMSELW